ncbi:MAG: HPF/RaiA family ribosome-associated protein [Burkholderiales bacterium]|nr:HPF/RaiA family ribosome-associated protein [Burkholderiales bacterium]
MQIQVNADNHIEASEARNAWARGVVESAMAHLADSVTRVELHLSDESAGKGGAPALRCTMEARVNGLAPVAVSNDAAGMDAAVNGAAHKLARATAHALGRADKHVHDERALPADDADPDTRNGEFVPSRAPF